ncbi:hypothetical protein JTB14_006767 [Gonioctena quinquepunctata]|nr:hypothetical protein JTB14_006767 [Gonioctena quinquepunctata]
MNDLNRDVAIKCENKKLRILTTSSGKENFILEMQAFSIIACYLSPNINMERYKELVDEILNIATTKAKSFVLMGDCNAAFPLRGAPSTDP